MVGESSKIDNTMIGHLCGDVLSLQPDRCVLRVGGVGYVVRICQRLSESVSCGDNLEVWIEHIMHEGESSLFGFKSEYEQKWFRWLIAVQGVGGRVALQILSAFPPDELCCILCEKRASDLRRAEGVGPKLAERLVTELGKKASQASPPSGGGVGLNSCFSDAVLAMCELGYSQSDAERAVGVTLKENPGADISHIVSKSLCDI